MTYDSPLRYIFGSLALILGLSLIPAHPPPDLHGEIAHSRCPSGANGHPAGCHSLYGWFHLWYELVFVSFVQTSNGFPGYDTGQISDLLLMDDFLKRFATCTDPMDAATCKARRPPQTQVESSSYLCHLV